MKIRYIAPVAMVATAAAIGLAPLAAAASTTTDTGAATVVQSPGNAQITTQPGAAALQSGEQQDPFFGYGGGLLFQVPEDGRSASADGDEMDLALIDARQLGVVDHFAVEVEPLGI